jgi:hypothetical protein
VPGEKEGVIGGEPGPFGAAGPDGYPACVSVQVLFDCDGTEVLHDLVLPKLNSAVGGGETTVGDGVAM